MRLTAAPAAKPAASFWLSPTKRRTSSAEGESALAAPLPPPLPASPPPPPRLVRSNSEGSSMPSTSLELTLPALDLAGSAAPLRSRWDFCGSRLLLDGEADEADADAAAACASPVLPESTTQYHRLASLNLDGAELPRPPSAAAAPQPAPAPPLSRRVSFASLTSLTSLIRGRPATAPPASGLRTAAASVAGLRPARRGGSPRLRPPGGPRPVDMSTVLYQAAAVRGGMDDLGLPPLVAPLWVGNNQNALGAMVAAGDRMREEYERRWRELATPLTQAELATLEAAAAAALRPAAAGVAIC